MEGLNLVLNLGVGNVAKTLQALTQRVAEALTLALALTLTLALALARAIALCVFISPSPAHLTASSW